MLKLSWVLWFEGDQPAFLHGRFCSPTTIRLSEVKNHFDENDCKFFFNALFAGSVLRLDFPPRYFFFGVNKRKALCPTVEKNNLALRELHYVM